VEEKSFVDFLHDLVLFCSEYDALKWKEIWTSWTYSQAIEFALHLVKRKGRQRDQLDGIEDPLALMMTMLMQRLR
jgi:hypothetical protein